MNRAELRELWLQCVNIDPRLDVERVALVLESALYTLDAINKVDDIEGADVEDMSQRIADMVDLNKRANEDAATSERELEDAREQIKTLEAKAERLEPILKDLRFILTREEAVS